MKVAFLPHTSSVRLVFLKPGHLRLIPRQSQLQFAFWVVKLNLGDTLIKIKDDLCVISGKASRVSVELSQMSRDISSHSWSGNALQAGIDRKDSKIHLPASCSAPAWAPASSALKYLWFTEVTSCPTQESWTGRSSKSGTAGISSQVYFLTKSFLSWRRSTQTFAWPQLLYLRSQNSILPCSWETLHLLRS